MEFNYSPMLSLHYSMINSTMYTMKTLYALLDYLGLLVNKKKKKFYFAYQSQMIEMM